MGSLGRAEGCPAIREGSQSGGEYGRKPKVPEQGRRNPRGWERMGPGVPLGEVAEPGDSGHLCRCSRAHQTEVIFHPGLGPRHRHQQQEDRCEHLTPTARPAAQRCPGSARLCPHHCFPIPVPPEVVTGGEPSADPDPLNAHTSLRPRPSWPRPALPRLPLVLPAVRHQHVTREAGSACVSFLIGSDTRNATKPAGRKALTPVEGLESTLGTV